tara:strand:+ start:2713 stop:3807 length:1095 start_codon:yes stop_codon:yes gene_type:complete
MSKGKTVVRESAKQEFPEWQKKGFEYLLNEGMAINETPFAPYTGETVAPFTPDELASQRTSRNIYNTTTGYNPVARMFDETQNRVDMGNPNELSVNQDFGRGNVRDIRNVNTGSILDRNLNNYMNPYTDQVIDKGLRDINKYRQMSLMSDQDAAIGSNAYGGSRSGILEAETNKNFNEQAADFVTDARQSAYQDAMAQARGDMDLASAESRFNAASDKDMGLMDYNLLSDSNKYAFDIARDNLDSRNLFMGKQADLDESKRNFDYGAYTDLLNTQYMASDDLARSGALQRGMAQQQLDDDYSEFMRKQNQPYTNLAASTSAISGVPVLINTEGTRTSKQKLGLGDAIGFGADLFGGWARGKIGG